MKLAYKHTDFPSGLSHILMEDTETPNPELVHYVLVLSNKGSLWIDVFWPYDEEAEQYSRKISEQQFWQTFREWRLRGISLGDSSEIAAMLSRKRLAKSKRKA
ncbi:MAG TPA: hypothetical protein VN370_05480 [Desulfitobacteriaceae bacterium]|jgi:hypothetical protein|nr:hypothetical protein [Desulfitobacteriaceae bacterium]